MVIVNVAIFTVVGITTYLTINRHEVMHTAEGEEEILREDIPITSVIKVFVSYMQIISMFRNLPLNYPSSLDWFFRLLNTATSIPGTLINGECAFDQDAEVPPPLMLSIFQILSPIYIIIVWALFFIISPWLSNCIFVLCCCCCDNDGSSSDGYLEGGKGDVKEEAAVFEKMSYEDEHAEAGAGVGSVDKLTGKAQVQAGTGEEAPSKPPGTANMQHPHAANPHDITPKLVAPAVALPPKRNASLKHDDIPQGPRRARKLYEGPEEEKEKHEKGEEGFWSWRKKEELAMKEGKKHAKYAFHKHGEKKVLVKASELPPDPSHDPPPEPPQASAPAPPPPPSSRQDIRSMVPDSDATEKGETSIRSQVAPPREGTPTSGAGKEFDEPGTPSILSQALPRSPSSPLGQSLAGAQEHQRRSSSGQGSRLMRSMSGVDGPELPPLQEEEADADDYKRAQAHWLGTHGKPEYQRHMSGSLQMFAVDSAVSRDPKSFARSSRSMEGGFVQASEGVGSDEMYSEDEEGIVWHLQEETFWIQWYQRFIVAAIVSIFFVYEDVVEAVLSLFVCGMIDEPAGEGSLSEQAGLFLETYWDNGPLYQCYVDKHMLITYLLGIPFLIIFNVGMPVMSAMFLYFYFEKLADLKFLNLYGFIYREYVPLYFYWESVIMTRKLVFAIAVAFSVNEDPATQVLILMGVIGFFLVIHVVCVPFSDDLVAWLEFSSLSVTLFSLYLGVYLVTGDEDQDNVKNTTTSLLIFILNLLMSLAFCIAIIYTAMSSIVEFGGVENLERDPKTGAVLDKEALKVAVQASHPNKMVAAVLTPVVGFAMRVEHMLAKFTRMLKSDDMDDESFDEGYSDVDKDHREDELGGLVEDSDVENQSIGDAPSNLPPVRTVLNASASQHSAASLPSSQNLSRTVALGRTPAARLASQASSSCASDSDTPASGRSSRRPSRQPLYLAIPATRGFSLGSSKLNLKQRLENLTSGDSYRMSAASVRASARTAMSMSKNAGSGAPSRTGTGMSRGKGSMAGSPSPGASTWGFAINPASLLRMISSKRRQGEAGTSSLDSTPRLGSRPSRASRRSTRAPSTGALSMATSPAREGRPPPAVFMDNAVFNSLASGDRAENSSSKRSSRYSSQDAGAGRSSRGAGSDDPSTPMGGERRLSRSRPNKTSRTSRGVKTWSEVARMRNTSVLQAEGVQRDSKGSQLGRVAVSIEYQAHASRSSIGPGALDSRSSRKQDRSMRSQKLSMSSNREGASQRGAGLSSSGGNLAVNTQEGQPEGDSSGISQSQL